MCEYRANIHWVKNSEPSLSHSCKINSEYRQKHCPPHPHRPTYVIVVIVRASFINNLFFQESSSDISLSSGYLERQCAE